MRALQKRAFVRQLRGTSSIMASFFFNRQIDQMENTFFSAQSLAETIQFRHDSSNVHFGEFDVKDKLDDVCEGQHTDVFMPNSGVRQREDDSDANKASNVGVSRSEDLDGDDVVKKQETGPDVNDPRSLSRSCSMSSSRSFRTRPSLATASNNRQGTGNLDRRKSEDRNLAKTVTAPRSRKGSREPAELIDDQLISKKPKPS